MLTARRTAIVTGASRGIGHAIAMRFHSDGWRVITVSRTPPPGVCPWSRERTHILLDLSDLDNVVRCIEIMRDMLGDGGLGALVNNAGISPKGRDGARLDSLETDVATWQSMFNTNFYAPLLMTRGFAAELAKARGAVVNLTSIAASRVHPFAGAAYATSKAALGALTREMAHDLAPMGIRVNAIAPGEIDTAILSPGTPQIVERDIPMRRLGTTEETADLIQFLCSPRAAYVTGAEIPINGGQHV
jgi:NAD(P)-dependent dehydrogenase (short-subunit alcohol dehydrogenase family)